MVNSLLTVITLGSKSKSNNTSLYTRLNERYHHYNSNRHRDYKSESIWRRITELVRNQYNSFRRYYKFQYNLCSNNSWGRLSTRSRNQSSRRNNWFSTAGNNRYRQRYNNKRYYYLLIGLLTVGCTPAYAGDDTYNTAAPESTATGNVTNQAVQFQNNGAPSRQTYSKGVSCNGPTMTFSPFWLASENKPYDPESYSRGWNYGGQLNFMVPLDYSTVAQCKRIARRVEEKMRVDYELVRALKCAELMQKGFTLRPGSRVEHMCNDVVPIVSVIKQQPTNHDDHPN